MTLADALVLCGAAAAGGALNSVAGGGSFFTFPALILAGVPPVAANATSTVALWPGSLASAAAYRQDLRKLRRLLLPMGLASLVGGGLGAWLLLHTRDETFARIVPWLLLIATTLLASSGPLTRALRTLAQPQPEHAPVLLTLSQLLIALYGGYFGGGMGILMLAGLALHGLQDIHAMNGLKSLLGVLINGVAVVMFVAAGAVHWPQALVMIAGAALGGYFGAALAKRVPAARVRWLAVAVGAVLTVVFFWKPAA